MDETPKTETIPKRLLILNAIFVLLILFVFFAIQSATRNSDITKEVEFPENTTESVAFSNIQLQAKSAYVFDVVKNEVIFKKNEFTQLPLASLTKLMTALTAVELFPKNSEITIQPEFLAVEGDSGLLANESWRLEDLIDFSLVVSSNDGVRSVASVIGAHNLNSADYNLGRKEFIAKMNENSQKLGLKQTYFINESGLDEGSTSGGYGSAIDVAKLLQYILVNHPEILEATKYASITINSEDASHVAANTNVAISSVPGLLASKTGFTSLAGGNLAIAFDASIGRPILVVVLGSSIDGRFNDIGTLVKATLAHIAEGGE